ncbi:MAG: efflux RND transporter permease subunit [Tannerella sp.]|jgi:multidrug efflux pump subunit AcrB|nr:efflux RND transporter permease subunit [Tannerella sp.]
MKYSPFSMIVAFLCLALAGVMLIPLLPVKLSPSRALPQLTVRYNMPGNSARVIEMTVTSRLEAMLSRIGGLREIRSTSGQGWGQVRLELDKHADLDAVRFETSTIVRQTWPGLPEGLSYPVVEMSLPDEQASRPFLSYTLNAAATPVFIQRYAENRIKPRLAGIPGIYRVDVSGATPMEWRLEYDHRQLEALGVSVDDLLQAIRVHYSHEFLGTAARRAEDGEWIRLVLATDMPEGRFDPSAISLAGRDGRLLRLDGLIRVTRQEEEPTGYYRINGLNSIYLSLRADDRANQLQLAAKVKAEMDAIRAELPGGYEIHTSYDATEYIRTELEKIYFRTGLTVLILLAFVLLITRSVRYLALIVVSLTVNLCIAVIFYYLFALEMQLYSLAGITISLSLVIDNTIVMADHIKNRHNRDAFLPILTATLTTAGALVIVFFLDEKIRLNLQDFAAVVIINLTVSLFVALFLVPGLIEKTGMFRAGRRRRRARRRPAALRRFMRRLPVWFSRWYMWQIRFICKWKKSVCLLLVLAFGLPVFLLPDKIEMKSSQTYSHTDSLLINTYNRAVANETYREKVKPTLEKALGGSLRLFVQKVYEGSYFTNREETVLNITANLPNGSTLEQMNHLVSRMETYLSSSGEIRQFQTNVYNARQARIDVFFTKEGERSGFPYVLKSRVITKAMELGGGSWGVWGLQDQGFSNDVRENTGSYRIEMYGYNYDELYGHAERLKEELLADRRIKEVTVNSEFSWWKDDYREFYFKLDKARLAEEHILPVDLFTSLNAVFRRNVNAGSIVVENEVEGLKLTSNLSREYDIWSMQYVPQSIRGVPYKLAGLASVEKGQAPQQVAKVNQQYRLCLQYEYIGASNQGVKKQERILEAFNETLPMGYSAKSDSYYWRWGQKDNSQYLLLLLIIVIIFFTTGILFNSLKQPLAVIFVIPVSYIGIFLTFYWFRLNFDQGGFASFILLSGITVNASIYILNEYNDIRRRKPRMSPHRAYIKAWNRKITPIFLTIVSTVLGFIPFMLGETREAFWFPLAAGTIGGLLMSVAGIYIYLPAFTLRRQTTGDLRKR